jgi:ATP-dependent DNA helicase RecG
MTLQELKRLAAKGESDRLEFKRTTGQRTDAAKTVCAMLNGLGGFVIFGVGDKGELVGQEIGQRTVEDVANELSRIEPPAFPEIETVTFKAGRSFIVLRVPGSGGLYNFDGRYYLRVGPTTRPMPRHQYERRLVERLHGTRRWENEPVPEWKEQADNVYVTFQPAAWFDQTKPTAQAQPESRPEFGHSSARVQPESKRGPLPDRLLQILMEGPFSKASLAGRLGQREVSGQLNKVIRRLLADGIVEQTYPEKPQSRWQRYRLSEKGRKKVRLADPVSGLSNVPAPGQNRRKNARVCT